MLDIRLLKTGKSHHEFDLEESDLEFDSVDLLGVVRANLWIDVDIHADEVFVKGEADVTLRLECARCLEPFDMHKVHSLALVINLARPGEISGSDREPSDDFFVLENSMDGFDFAPVVRERAILSMPMKPLCSLDCKGLCPKCGINLNTGSCDCPREIVDERFSVLEKLKDS